MVWQILVRLSLIAGASLVTLLFSMLSLGEVLAQPRHPQLGMFPRDKLPLLPSEFQQIAGTHGLSFTHRSDADQVVALQAKVFEQKMRLIHTISLLSLSRNDQQRLPHHILENGRLQHLQLRSCFFDEVESRSLLLKSLKLVNCGLSGLAASQLAAAIQGAPPCLVELDISWNRIKDMGAVALATAVATANTADATIQRLHFEAAPLGMKGLRPSCVP